MKKNENICPIDYTVHLMGGKWKLKILHALIGNSPKRFMELQRQIPNITPTMLTSQLRFLEQEGLINRKIFPTIPPTVEYSLTEHGKSMKSMIAEIESWGISHLKKLNKLG